MKHTWQISVSQKDMSTISNTGCIRASECLRLLSNMYSMWQQNSTRQTSALVCMATPHTHILSINTAYTLHTL